MIRRHPNPLAAALLALTPACADIDEWYSIHPVVWSDDSSALAYAVQRRDILHNGDNEKEEERNPRFEIWTIAPDGSAREQWHADAGLLGDLYYMRHAGYILFAHSGDAELTFELVRRSGEKGWVLDADGHDDVCDRCSVLSTIPSPSGALIAVTYWRYASSELAAVHAYEVVRQSDGASIWGPMILDVETGGAFWTEDEQLMIGRNETTAHHWSPDEESLDIVDLPACRPPLAPETSSSLFDAEGGKVCGGETTESPTRSCECYFFPNANRIWCDDPPDFGALPLVPFGCP